jgi:hypothetical protein
VPPADEPSTANVPLKFTSVALPTAPDWLQSQVPLVIGPVLPPLALAVPVMSAPVALGVNVMYKSHVPEARPVYVPDQ